MVGVSMVGVSMVGVSSGGHHAVKRAVWPLVCGEVSRFSDVIVGSVFCVFQNVFSVLWLEQDAFPKW